MKTRKLPVKLSDAEISAKGREISGLVSQLDRIRDEKRAELQGFKERTKAAELGIRAASRCVESGEEEREVAIDERPDFKNGVVEVWRLDTGELVTKRIMTEEERQTNALELIEGGKADEPT